jgi:glycosyltransferase involved in cell wall biosynthesis
VNLFIISELNPSDLTTRIIRTAQEKELPIKVFYIQKKNEGAIHKGLDSVKVDQYLGTSSIRQMFHASFVLISSFLLERPRLVYCSGRLATIFGILLGKLCLIPNRIFTRHHGLEIQASKLILPRIIEKLTNRFATKIVAISNLARDILIRENVNPIKIEVIHNGIDLEQALKVRQLRQRRNESDKKDLIIGVVSRLTYWKGVENTAIAFKRILEIFPNAKLEIYGSKMDSYADILGVLTKLPTSRYQFFEPDGDIFSKYQNFDLFIHVPIGLSEEAFGLVYLEALAAGVPSIFTRSGILDELDVGTSAIIIDYNDSTGIELAAKDFLESKADNFKPINISDITQFDLNLMVAKYLTLLFDSN